MRRVKDFCLGAFCGYCFNQFLNQQRGMDLEDRDPIFRPVPLIFAAMVVARALHNPEPVQVVGMDVSFWGQMGAAAGTVVGALQETVYSAVFPNR